MASLRDTRLRIRTIKQTLQVTKAMNLISTSKLRKGRSLLSNTEPYFNRIQRTMTNILNGAGSVNSPYFRKGEKGHQAIIAVTSDKGLAGGYNSNVYHYVSGLLSTLPNPVLVLSGQVGQRYFTSGPKVMETFSFGSRMPTIEDAKEISDFVISQFEWGVFDEIRIVYTQMFNVLRQKPVERLLLPLDRDEMRTLRYAGEALPSQFDGSSVPKGANEHFEYVPSPEEVFNALAPQYVTGLIYGALVEGYASEQAERMMAMDQSSRNAEDMLANLQIFYNRARQAAITQEMTEIVSGSAALQD
jgi:F-type H+-transporting ATPase subunit gamma